MYSREEFLSKIATMYYEENMSQVDISHKLGISRPTIGKFLKEAKEKGIVRITISHPFVKFASLEEKIKKTYNLDTVSICPGSSDSQSVKRNIGANCASFLEYNIDRFKTIGIGWGTTVNEVVQNLSYMTTTVKEVVPLVGGLSINDSSFHSNQLAFQLSQKLQSVPNYLYAPIIAENDLIYKTFISTDLISDVLDKGRKVDLVISGVGNPANSLSYKHLGYLSDKDKEEISKEKAIGDILASFFDGNGEEVKTTFSNRMIGLKLDELLHIPHKLVVASSVEKVKSLQALLVKGLVDYLFIDSTIAEKLISNHTDN